MKLSGIMDGLIEIGVALLLTVLATCVGDTGAGEPHAPCFNCERFSLITHQQTLHGRQVRQVRSSFDNYSINSQARNTFVYICLS